MALSAYEVRSAYDRAVITHHAFTAANDRHFILQDLFNLELKAALVEKFEHRYYANIIRDELSDESRERLAHAEANKKEALTNYNAGKAKWQQAEQIGWFERTFKRSTYDTLRKDALDLLERAYEVSSPGTTAHRCYKEEFQRFRDAYVNGQHLVKRAA